MEMDKKTYEQLTRPFNKEEIQPAPKGKFGKFVPHHLITKRLNEVVAGKWNYIIKEVIRNKDGEIEEMSTLMIKITLELRVSY